ncbi:MAG: hypothetical protein AAF554_06560 [Bacteroidota bacterium]
MEFDLQRIAFALRRDMVLLKNTFITGILVGSIILFLLCLFNMVWDQKLSPDEFLGSFTLCLFPLGILFTFTVFREFHDPKLNASFLTLPLASGERLVAKWLLCVPLFVIAFSIVGTLVGFFAMLCGAFLFQAPFDVTILFQIGYWKTIFMFSFVQPVFMVGALSFSKNRLGKTVLILGLLFVSFLFFNFIGFGLLNHDFGIFYGNEITSEAFDEASGDFSIIGKWFYGLIFGPVMLWVAYLKIKEKQV